MFRESECIDVFTSLVSPQWALSLMLIEGVVSDRFMPTKALVGGARSGGLALGSGLGHGSLDIDGDHAIAEEVL